MFRQYINILITRFNAHQRWRFWHQYLSVVLASAVMLFLISCGGSYERPDYQSVSTDTIPVSEGGVVSAAHPKAVEAGLEVLRRGGHAADAAVAVQMVLNVVEPPESGIGGGAFMLYHDGSTGELGVYDGREVAPSEASKDRFMMFDRSMPLWMAVPSGLSVGVPGTVAMLYKAHSEQGMLPWESLFSMAIELAEQGVPVSDRLERQLGNDPSILLFRDTRRHFFHQVSGEEPEIRNQKLAQTFRRIASEGPEAFYTGDIAAGMVEAVSARWPGPGDLQLEDLKNYKPVSRQAVCMDYRIWRVCGMPPPSSGGVTLLQILGKLEQFPLGEMTPGEPAALHLIAEASRLGFADRAQYIGDPAFVDVPTTALLDSTYLKDRASLIDRQRAAENVLPGSPGPDRTALSGSKVIRAQQGTSGTSHFSIVDRHGNAVAMTTSIESPFGSRIMANGFLLNNQLTDFDFNPGAPKNPAPNAVAPGKRPRSSMAPVMVFNRNDELVLIAGSRGGSRIIGYVLKTLVGVLDWEMPLQKAISLPNVLHQGESLELESLTPWSDYAGDLEALGHRVEIRAMESGVHGIERVDSEGRLVRENKDSGQPPYMNGVFWRGGADPRMGGAAFGEDR